MRFEYRKVRTGVTLTDAELNALGYQRWELVSICQDVNDYFYHFKRERLAEETV